ncbi:MAG: hypothetical protein EMLJLAPB_01196 [Candidatus Argoarchaeum ethanivorans]|uniref:Uncharacterized protein n=1 Tax=Candidatus Argoarchaeum ethanivorans TaxID=2608793 RepID=A0A811TH50_9EURY|nr:MAG: hypothetical protein EMLJLAPB_01196 [Candidatus Argoarchaeum ethanivorans]
MSIIVILVQTLIPIVILVILVWKKQWQILLGISILAASNGFFAQNTYLIGDTMGTLSGCSSYTEMGEIRCLQTHISMLELVVISFLKAIFILILAIFAWLQKGDRSIERINE